LKEDSYPFVRRRGKRSEAQQKQRRGGGRKREIAFPFHNPERSELLKQRSRFLTMKGKGDISSSSTGVYPRREGSSPNLNSIISQKRRNFWEKNSRKKKSTRLGRSDTNPGVRGESDRGLVLKAGKKAWA